MPLSGWVVLALFFALLTIALYMESSVVQWGLIALAVANHVYGLRFINRRLIEMNREELRSRVVHLIERVEHTPLVFNSLSIQEQGIIRALMDLVQNDDGPVLDGWLDNLPPASR